MQMTVELRQESERPVDYDHNYRLAASIFEAIRAFHPEAGRAMHASRERSKLAIGEIYHLPRAKYEASFRIASPDEHLLRLVGGALVAVGKLQVGKATYVVRGTEMHATGELPPPVGLHTLSPILIRGRDSPLSLVHDNCDYPTVLAEVINYDIKRATGRAGSVRVVNMGKLEVRKRSLAGRTVMAQKGTFWLDAADGRDLGHVLDWGVGHSTGMGFGMVVSEGSLSG
jgi:CRISPR-associated endoribonuclease Cas6